MILVDSSALLEYYRPAGDPGARTAVEEAIAEDLAAVNGIVRVEILAFARTESDRDKLESDFRSFHWLDLGRLQFDLAAAMGFSLRRQGIAVPATDLIIAASAIQASATLFHVDGHFDLIAQHSELDARRL